MRWPCMLIGAVAVLGIGCADADRLMPANQVVREYLDAAARRDRSRVCALRTEGVLSRWGGQVACERRAKGLLLGPYQRRLTPRRVKMQLTRRGLTVDAAAAKVLPADTSEMGNEARVVVDFGKAYVQSGHAIGGEILEFDLKREDGQYRVAGVDFAVFAD
jgi:hypothetical protein